jgi:hypothetical protein
LDEPLCLADFNHTPTVAAWLRQRKAALLAPFKDDTSFEQCHTPEPPPNTPWHHQASLCGQVMASVSASSFMNALKRLQVQAGVRG